MAMGVFESDKELTGSPKYIPQLAEKICQTFAADGFETSKEMTSAGGCDISLYKGGLFKAVLGMKSALKVTMIPQNGNIYIKAGVGIFGQQAIPTAISVLFFWPVLLAQIWGMVQQSKLDDLAVNIAEEELNRLMRNERSHYAAPQSATVAMDQPKADIADEKPESEQESYDIPPRPAPAESAADLVETAAPVGPAAQAPEAAPSPVEAGAAVVGGMAQPAAPQAEAKAKFCPECGEPIVPGSKFCVNCGKKL